MPAQPVPAPVEDAPAEPAAATAVVAKSSEIKALTGLRGIAALYVVLFHANGLFAFPTQIRPFLRHGYIAVDLFFILSGFVMAMTYGHMFKDGFSFGNFKRFLMLRLARIYPLYILVTLVTALMITTVLSETYHFADDVLRALPSNIAMTHVWGLAYSIVPQTWSISAEWAAYLLFPLGAALAMWGPRRYALLGAAAAFGLLIYIAYGPYWLTLANKFQGQINVVHSYAPGTLLRCLASFYLGLVAFRFRDQVPAQAAAILAPAALALLWFRSTDLSLVVTFTLLIMALSYDTGPVARLLQTRIIYWLGGISFALYLVHDLIQKIIFHSLPAWGIGTDLPSVVWLLISLALCLGVASLAHYGYERPSRRWSRKLINEVESRGLFTTGGLKRAVNYLRSLAVRPTTPAE
jgi:peptidoglycan/LPS O-acetylase OafA/YrhL